MDKKLNNQVIGTDMFGITSDYAPVAKSYGFPTLSKYRCCADTFGTEIDLLESTPMQISGFGLPIYSDMNKCFKFDTSDLNKINTEMEKNNLNPKEIYDAKQKAKKNKKKQMN